MIILEGNIGNSKDSLSVFLSFNLQEIRCIDFNVSSALPQKSIGIPSHSGFSLEIAIYIESGLFDEVQLCSYTKA